MWSDRAITSDRDFSAPAMHEREAERLLKAERRAASSARLVAHPASPAQRDTQLPPSSGSVVSPSLLALSNPLSPPHVPSHEPPPPARHLAPLHSATPAHAASDATPSPCRPPHGASPLAPPAQQGAGGDSKSSPSRHVQRVFVSLIVVFAASLLLLSQLPFIMSVLSPFLSPFDISVEEAEQVEQAGAAQVGGVWSQLRQQRGSLALLFLTRGPIPLAPLWKKFLRVRPSLVRLPPAALVFVCPSLVLPHSCFPTRASPLGHEGRYSIYVHASNASFSFPPGSSPLFRGRLVPGGEVRWGEMSMVDAERRLLEAAVQDEANSFFALLSESCIPLWPFDYVYSYIASSSASFVDAYSDPYSMSFGRYIPHIFMPTIRRHQFLKGNQWFILQRRHAEAVVRDTLHYTRHNLSCAFRLQWGKLCCADEHYIQTFLHMTDPRGISRYPTTFTDWSANEWHPSLYLGANMTDQVITTIKVARLSATFCHHHTTKSMSAPSHTHASCALSCLPTSSPPLAARSKCHVSLAIIPAILNPHGIYSHRLPSHQPHICLSTPRLLPCATPHHSVNHAPLWPTACHHSPTPPLSLPCALCYPFAQITDPSAPQPPLVSPPPPHARCVLIPPHLSFSSPARESFFPKRLMSRLKTRLAHSPSTPELLSPSGGGQRAVCGGGGAAQLLPLRAQVPPLHTALPHAQVTAASWLLGAAPPTQASLFESIGRIGCLGRQAPLVPREKPGAFEWSSACICIHLSFGQCCEEECV
ncbi:unnamed protein product [Closterium sp. Naga37s-1]|nr:unnamed protein product [Closterium sp. Naga37s-1]